MRDEGHPWVPYLLLLHPYPPSFFFLRPYQWGKYDDELGSTEESPEQSLSNYLEMMWGQSANSSAHVNSGIAMCWELSYTVISPSQSSWNVRIIIPIARPRGRDGSRGETNIVCRGPSKCHAAGSTASVLAFVILTVLLRGSPQWEKDGASLHHPKQCCVGASPSPAHV